jgi:hypothetical protein
MPIEIGLQGRSAPGVGLRRHLPGRAGLQIGNKALRALPRSGAIGNRPLRRLRRFADVRNRPSSKALRARRRPPPLSRKALTRQTQKTPPRSAQADRRPKAPGGRIHSAHKPTAGRRPSRRLKSAFQGAARQASAPPALRARRRPKAFMPPPTQRDTSPVGAGRPKSASKASAPGVEFIRHTETPSRSAQAFTPIEIGLPRRCAPGVGLRRRKRHPPGRRRPTAGRRPLEAEFIRHTGRPPAEGLHAD